MIRHRLLSVLLVVSLSFIRALEAPAVARSWDDGTGPGNLWSGAVNWTGDLLPTSVDAVLLGDLASAAGDQTRLGDNFIIASLAITNGVTVNTDGYELQVNGLVVVSGADPGITVVPNTDSVSDPDALDVEGVTLNSGGSLLLLGGRVELESGMIHYDFVCDRPFGIWHYRTH